MKRFTALLLALCFLALIGCGNKGELTEEGFTDTKTGIEYVEVEPMGLYPVQKGDELLTLKKGGETIAYYEVLFEDTSEFLCYEIEGNLFLVRAKTAKEPTVSEFNPIAATIYNAANTYPIDNFFADVEYLPEDKKNEFTVGETALCKLAAEAITNGEAVELNFQYEDLDALYYIRLLSQDYPGLYYLISFFRYNGRCFLRDDRLGKTVYCPNDLIARMGGD